MSYRPNTAETWHPQPEPSAAAHDIDLRPPESLTKGLLQSLLENFRDTFAPEKLPPLQLVSRPVDLGLPLGDQLRMPWYRTVFTNLGEVISPETLPPLELESVPVDVGELVSDQLSHIWISSLLRNLADQLVPERLPKLELTSKPIDNIILNTWILLPMWSEVISTPKVFYPDKPKVPSASVAIQRPVPAGAAAAPVAGSKDLVEAVLLRDLRRSRIRSYIWMSMAAAQAIYLIVFAVQSYLSPH
jgi:hypothetical protein